jgi:23S rRNA (uracil1939-C5)-methyltransferase
MLTALTCLGRTMARVDELLPALAVESLDQDGRGIARHEGKVVFVDGALPGETVSARVFRRRRRFDLARVETVLQASPERVTPRCAHFGTCGGCALQHLAPAAQLRCKQDDVLDKLRHIGGVRPVAVQAPLQGPLWAYRRKARLGVRHVPGKGGVLVGFRERGNSYIADLHRCEVLVPAVGERIDALRELLSGLRAHAQIPQIEVAATAEVTLLVFRHLEPLHEDDLARMAAFATEHGVAVALQSGGPDSVRALEPVPSPPLRYALPEHGVDLQFGALDFVQVNETVNATLVSAAVDALDPQPGERVLDLFCGLGNFSLAIARRGAEVLGVELASEMAARLRRNARDNGLQDRVQAEVGDLSDVAVTARLLQSPPARALIDPPRSGAAAVVEALPARGAHRLVYVSCNPATLARDAGVLCHRQGYRLESLRVVDMFPHTNHVESLAVFERE